MLKINNAAKILGEAKSILYKVSVSVSISVILLSIRELSDFIINILICVLEMNAGLTGLEQREGE